MEAWEVLSDPRPYFESLTDPRRETQNKLHKLGDIVFIVLCAVLSGIEDWANMEEFAEAKEDWLRQFIELPNGIPSHDTLSDVFGRLKPKQFASCFTAWAESALPSLAGEHIAIDGKTLRGSSHYGEGAVHLMSAFAARARLVLTQAAVSEKSNEITAIPDLLSCLELKGAMVSIDAMGCQKNIAANIVDAGADYVLALKENHLKFHDAVKSLLEAEDASGRAEERETIDHGRRVEIRRYVLSDRVDLLLGKESWAGLAAVGMVESTRDVQGKVSTERRYYISSTPSMPRFMDTVRGHWSIENAEHWVLDVQFGEDRNRARKDHSAENLAAVRRMSLNMVRHNVKDKRSLKRRKTLAALDDRYRTALLFGTQGPS